MKQIFAEDTFLTKIKCLSPDQVLRCSQGIDIGNDFMFQRIRVEIKSISGYWESSVEDDCTNVMINGSIFILKIKFDTLEKKVLKYKRSFKILELIHN